MGYASRCKVKGFFSVYFQRREYLHLSLISSLERSLASAQLAGGPWGPLFGDPYTADVRDEEGRSQAGASRASSPGAPVGGPTLRGLVLDPAAQLEIKTLRMRLVEAEGALERAREAQAAQQFSGQRCLYTSNPRHEITSSFST